MNEIPGVFLNTVQKSVAWLHEIEKRTGWNEQRAYRALRATMHVLRDRLTIDQAAHLGAQLPMLVRGFYYEGWHPAGVPRKDISSRDDFLRAVGQEADDPGLDAEAAARTVLAVMATHITDGGLRKVREQLPKGIASLLPDGGAADQRETPIKPQPEPDFIAQKDGIRQVHH